LRWSGKHLCHIDITHWTKERQHEVSIHVSMLIILYLLRQYTY